MKGQTKVSKNTALDVGKIIEEFQKSEANGGHRKDAFKIEGKFEDVVKRIAKAKPTIKKAKG